MCLKPWYIIYKYLKTLNENTLSAGILILDEYSITLSWISFCDIFIIIINFFKFKLMDSYTFCEWLVCIIYNNNVRKLYPLVLTSLRMLSLLFLKPFQHFYKDQRTLFNITPMNLYLTFLSKSDKSYYYMLWNLIFLSN